MGTFPTISAAPATPSARVGGDGAARSFSLGKPARWLRLSAMNLSNHRRTLLAACAALLVPAAVAVCRAEAPAAPKLDESKLAAISQRMAEFVEKKEVAGAVTLVVTPGKVAHLKAVGSADVAKGTAMKTDAIFWIASMTKPVTATAIMMLQDEGKLSVDDPAVKYLPEFAQLKMKDGSAPPEPITLRHLMTHTAGLPENSREETRAAKTLQDLVVAFTRKPMNFEPGAKWAYSQTAINSLGRIVEVASGKDLETFFQERLFVPLGMTDTTFYPTKQQQPRIATAYKAENGALSPTEVSLFAGRDLAERNRVPHANGGLYSTAADYGRFIQMILNDGSLDGKQYVTPQSVKLMTSAQTVDLKTGFTPGNAWGLGWCVVRDPKGVSGMLSPGSFGHGGAYGTQAWIDPQRRLGFVLMVQRSNFPNSDNSDVRKAFQEAAVAAVVK